MARAFADNLCLLIWGALRLNSHFAGVHCMALDKYSLTGMLSTAKLGLHSVADKLSKEMLLLHSKLADKSITPESVEAYAKALIAKIEELQSLEIKAFEAFEAIAHPSEDSPLQNKIAETENTLMLPGDKTDEKTEDKSPAESQSETAPDSEDTK